MEKKNSNKQNNLSGAMARRARQQEEERLRLEIAKKKKKKMIIIIACALVVILTCSIAIPLGLKSTENEYFTIELKNLCNEQGTAVSAAIKALNGKKVVVKGYLLECTSYTRFLAGSTNAPCPFATQKYVTNVIPAVYKNGDEFSASIDSNKLYVVYGTLHVGDTAIASYYNSQKQAYDDEIAGMVIYIERFEKA